MSLDPIGQLNLITIVGVMVVFVLTMLVLRKTFFRPILGVMEKRNAKIEQGRLTREEAARTMADAQLRAEKVWTDSAAEKEQAVAAIEAGIASWREQRLTQSRAEADSILEAGRTEVESLRESEESRMRDSLTACVVETLSTMLDTVDERTVRAMVDNELSQQSADRTAT